MLVFHVSLPSHMFRYESVIVEYVKLRAFLSPFALLCERQWY